MNYLPYFTILCFSLAAWDFGRRMVKSDAQSEAHAKAINRLKVDLGGYATRADLDAIKAQLQAQSTILAKHATQLTKEALEKTQPLVRMKKY